MGNKIKQNSVKIWFEYFGIKPKGILHVGAHLGQELEFYESIGVQTVVWFEAEPEIFKQLEFRIKNYPNHKAINSLLASTSGRIVTFYISSNEKMSSSIGKPLHHTVVFPDIKFNEQVKLITDTLDNAINSFSLDIKNFDCLVLDTQGSELEVLKGFPLGLKNIDVIVTKK